MNDADAEIANELPIGLYDQVISRHLEQLLEPLSAANCLDVAALDNVDAHSAVAQYLERLIVAASARYRGGDSTERLRQFADRLIAVIQTEFDDADSHSIASPLRRLLAIHRRTNQGESRPDTPLGRSTLLTGTRIDPSLASQLRKEIATADRVDILCSFIKWSGLRLLVSELQQLTGSALADMPRLRVITTSYLGATDPKAVEFLRDLPNTEVRVSYDTQRTRLHAKAYLIHRVTGFGSAYIGSANLSHAALSEGLEWTTKVSQFELPHLWSKIVGTFETYWNDDEFEPFNVDGSDRLRHAITRERGTVEGDNSPLAVFNLHPYPFQEEILDVLASEREVQGKNRHLVVAATGTGKTLVAAFDYERWSRSQTHRPPLLFVAHREEILRQALGSFRAVLRDHNFGDLVIANQGSEQAEHLFCSIQSFNSRELWRLPPDRFRYVVVDEFHHAAAPSYRRLMDHVNPGILLALTATPERSDQLDVLHWFGGEPSAEIRLPDAINRRLLCPFQYFGVADCVDLDTLNWQRGGYRVEDLDKLYTGNDLRAGLVLDKTREILLDPKRARGIGFCVSVAHAEFMARFFADHGLPAAALSGLSLDDHRQSIQERLRRRDINFIFVVDLYNEGVDIPEIDAVLFLRPTESLTVFLQQLGRGLRLHHEKDCLTVLDFIGAQRREFRFAPRLRALSSSPTAKLDDEIESGFPHLPPGCVIRLERIAQQRVLANVRASLRQQRPRIVADLRELARHLGRAPTLREAIEFLDIPLDELLKRGLWSRLLADAGVIKPINDPDEERLARGLLRMSHINDPIQIQFLLRHIASPRSFDTLKEVEAKRLLMFHGTLWGNDEAEWLVVERETRLRTNLAALCDLQAMLEHRLTHTQARIGNALPEIAGSLALHADYTRDEILFALGHWTPASRPDVREGVLHLPQPKLDVFFVTLQKAEHEYSPTTMYEDYAVSPELFHWQSQSTTSVTSPTGQRYLRHRENGYTPMLFVREHKRLPSGLSAPYAFLGPTEYVSHQGTRPISIIWRMRYPIPARLLRPFARQRVS